MESIKKSKTIKVLLVILAIVLLWTAINSIRVNALDTNSQRGQAQIIDVGGWSLPPGGSKGGTEDSISLDAPDSGGEASPFDLGDGWGWGWDNGPYIGWSWEF